MAKRNKSWIIKSLSTLEAYIPQSKQTEVLNLFHRIVWKAVDLIT